MKNIISLGWLIIFALLTMISHAALSASHPNLVVTEKDVFEMRNAIQTDSKFTQAYLSKKQSVDAQIAMPINVPIPKDSGGGFTHERHKKNYNLMYDAGVIYQLTQDEKYANYVRDMLLAYGNLYPDLPLHPKRRANANNPGKLFWQSLNEAVWLVYTIQAYDLIYNSLTSDEVEKIETNAIRPVVKFLSVDSPATFNKVHNHGTWLTAGVGMAGYVLDEKLWVEQALYDLDQSGKGGFLRQLTELFSPDGYYNEGPYYQRYALMPFVTFAKAIQVNEPERKIFEYRNGVMYKAIDTTIQLSYNKLFFPINDAIKDKGIDTAELVLGTTIAYGLSEDPGLLDIAKQQDQILLTGDGLKVASAIESGLLQPYKFKSYAFGDGKDGDEGALVVFRQTIQDGREQAVVFKPAAQGLGHGHFDKLTWIFYDAGEEIVSDYGAARFLNVEAKNGGQYLPENKTYAKQTVAHNTVVVNETSHFNNNLKTANTNHPDLVFFAADDQVKISSAQINSAYPNVKMQRTMAMLNVAGQSFVIDVFSVNSKNASQYDLPLHYRGQIVDANFDLKVNTDSLRALGSENGYQHLWQKSQATPAKGMAQITWLNDSGHFYTQSSAADGNTQIILTQIGANDPNFNLRNENAFITRATDSKNHTFVSVLEPHGEYNPSKEFTIEATSKVTDVGYQKDNGIDLVIVSIIDGHKLILAFNANEIEDKTRQNSFTFAGKKQTFNGRYKLFTPKDL